MDERLDGRERAAAINNLRQSVGIKPFISGVGGKQSSDGLHDTYMICPAPGSEVAGVYKRVKNACNSQK